MSRQGLIIGLLVLIWVGLVAASFLMAGRIEGPRNLDTGFQRLDVFARYQFAAFGVAVVAAVAGLIWRRASRRLLLAGLAPLSITLLVVLGLFVYTRFFLPAHEGEVYELPPTEAAPAIEVPNGE